MRIQIFQSSRCTPPGSVSLWAEKHDYDIQLTEFFKRPVFPELASLDWLVLCGGGMNVDQYDKYPWLREQREFVREAIAAGKVVVGLCLGGQMIARALGSEVRPHTQWESGWHPVRLLDSGRELMVFHWHHDTFDLPPGARLIATNDVCRNQAFTVGDRVVGFQFHPETTPEWVNYLAFEDDDDPPVGPYAQKTNQLIEGIRYQPAMQAWFFSFLDELRDRTRPE